MTWDGACEGNVMEEFWCWDVLSCRDGSTVTWSTKSWTSSSIASSREVCGMMGSMWFWWGVGIVMISSWGWTDASLKSLARYIVADHVVKTGLPHMDCPIHEKWRAPPTLVHHYVSHNTEHMENYFHSKTTWREIQIIPDDWLRHLYPLCLSLYPIKTLWQWYGIKLICCIISKVGITTWSRSSNNGIHRLLF